MVIGGMVLAGVLTGLAPALSAQGASPPKTPGETPPAPQGSPTRIGQELLLETDLLVEARTDSVSAGALGVEVARLDLITVMAGNPPPLDPRSRRRQVLVIGFPGTFAPGERQIVFLRALSGGARFEVVHRIPTGGEHYAERLAVCRRTAELARITDATSRARATLDWLLPALGSRDAWWSRYALEELDYMAARQPWVFSDDTAERIRRATVHATDPAFVAGVKNVAQRVEDLRRSLSEQEEKARSLP